MSLTGQWFALTLCQKRNASHFFKPSLNSSRRFYGNMKMTRCPTNLPMCSLGNGCHSVMFCVSSAFTLKFNCAFLYLAHSSHFINIFIFTLPKCMCRSPERLRFHDSRRFARKFRVRILWSSDSVDAFLRRSIPQLGSDGRAWHGRRVALSRHE